MKVLFILGLLLPFGVIASPEAIPEVPVESLAERSAGPEPAEELFRRAVTCQIIGNDGPVACRTRPSTTGDLVARLPVGNYYSFTCYARGTSVGGNTYVPSRFCSKRVIKI